MKVLKYEKKMQKAIRDIAKLVGNRGFSKGTRSSLSQRLDNNRFQITPEDVYLYQMKQKRIVTLDETGYQVYRKYGWQPNEAYPLHIAVYNARGDVNGIIHAHPVNLSAMSLAVDILETTKLPESLQVLGRRLTIDNFDIQEKEISTSLRNALTNGNVILLPQDGVLVVGRDLEHAYEQLEEMEHAAKVYTIARSAGFFL